MHTIIHVAEEIVTIEYIDCPRARTWMTPCIARDGHTALADGHGRCVGCEATVWRLLRDLGDRYPPARDAEEQAEGSPRAAADLLAEHVAAYVEAKKSAREERVRGDDEHEQPEHGDEEQKEH